MQITKVLVPSITLPVLQIQEKLDNIDLINLAAAELKLKEQRKRLDEKMHQVFGSTSTTSKSVKHITKLEPLTMESLKLGRNKGGETSSKMSSIQWCSSLSYQCSNSQKRTQWSLTFHLQGQMKKNSW